MKTLKLRLFKNLSKTIGLILMMVKLLKIEKEFIRHEANAVGSTLESGVLYGVNTNKLTSDLVEKFHTFLYTSTAILLTSTNVK